MNWSDSTTKLSRADCGKVPLNISINITEILGFADYLFTTITYFCSVLTFYLDISPNMFFFPATWLSEKSFMTTQVRKY